MSADRVKLVALYFPQLHRIPENDKWWGPGFTDWVNVKRAKPLYPGHRQPRVPLDHDYYDQSDPKVIRRQVAMAREHGISAFCHYHYWFNGKQLLETPTNLLMSMKDLDIEFCLSWANETWSRRWDGQDDRVLQLQTHPPTKEAWGRHFDYLIKAWTDPRALRINGKPVFLIYRPDKVQELGNMLDYWRERARAYDLDDLYFIGVVQYQLPPWKTLRHLDAAFMFQPFVSWFSLLEDEPAPLWRRHFSGAYQAAMKHVPVKLKAPILAMLEKRQGPTQISYEDVWQRIIDYKPERAVTTFEGAFVDWDNTARYGERAKIYTGANPERFQHWMGQLVDKVSRRPPDERIVFINAWNEWAEGAYLEPDTEMKDGYLRALKQVMQSTPHLVSRAANDAG
jgi:lipopolysaccharide biosynthesis protein